MLESPRALAKIEMSDLDRTSLHNRCCDLGHWTQKSREGIFKPISDYKNFFGDNVQCSACLAFLRVRGI